VPAVICPVCGKGKARRRCPALEQQICAVCCGTKRLVQIQCPSDCAWLASAREHPPAIILRRQERDLGLVLHVMRDLSERQSTLLFLIFDGLLRYEPPELQPLVDDDVAEAADALAATFETAARGIIYEHRPASLAAERLVSALAPLVDEAGKGSGSSFERDAAVVLRRLADAVGHVRAGEPDNRCALLELVGRVIRTDQRAPRILGPDGQPTGESA